MLSEFYELTFNGLTWYGFTAEERLVFANGAGGQLLQEARSSLVTKVDKTFYLMDFDASDVKQAEQILMNFELLD